MNVRLLLTLALVAFVAFFIGLNLALHGILSVGFQRTKSAAGVNDGLTNRIVVAGVSSHPTDVPFVNKRPYEEKIVNSTTKVDEVQSSGAHQLLVASPAHPTHSDNQESLEHIMDSINHAVVARFPPSLVYKNGELSTFLQGGNRLPILLMTCNRPGLLKQTLLSLQLVRGVNTNDILVSQDGNDKEIERMVFDAGLQLVQNTRSASLRGAKLDGAARIALHYKFSLTSVFEKFPLAPAAIIIEDDLLFSPDFYEFFGAGSHVLDEDSSVFVISAWNDNGFIGKVKEPFALRRSDYFPGLGWMLTRKLYKTELEAKWPNQHWDHWLRSPEISRGREIVYPQVPRSYHNGIKGTFMDLKTHNRYFRDIAYNMNSSVVWPSCSETARLASISGLTLSAPYEYRIEKMIESCTHVGAVNQLAEYRGRILCLWIDVLPEADLFPPFAPIAEFFGIWHEHRRGSHRGLHEFYWYGNYILLLNVHGDPLSRRATQLPSSYKHLMPNSAKLLSPQEFDKSVVSSIKRKVLNTIAYPSAEMGASCDKVCSSIGKSCFESGLHVINTCEELTANFRCQRCFESRGLDQPAFVSELAASAFSPGSCLINADKTSAATCAASHLSTFRLCACQ